MFLLIAKDGSLSLEDSEAMKSFCVVESPDAPQQGTASAALAAIAEKTADDHFWISAEAIVQVSPNKDDPKWVSDFWEMLKKVEPYGYYDADTQRVKAHVEVQT